MTLSSELRDLTAACFTGVWIESHEHDDAIAEIAGMCREEGWQLATWDVASGLNLPGQGEGTDSLSGSDPLAAISSINALATPDGSALLVLRNFHKFLGSAEVIQRLAQQIAMGKQNRTFVVVLSPVVQIPVELDKHFVVLEHELPSRDELEGIVQGIATEAGELPEDDELERVLDSAAGLTRFEAEGAFSLSLVRDGQVRPQAIWDLKCQSLKKSGLLTLHRGGESFDQLGGLDAMKSFCMRIMRRQSDTHPLKRPRGVLLLSPPGCGKSHFAKALGNATGRPTLVLDIGALMGSLVGQTESNIRQALKIADAMDKCVIFVDELDKALSGVAGSGQNDSGVSARLFGTLLSWMQDHTSDVFVVATANSVDRLPPEMSRAERFDGVFFVDLPGTAQKARIWDIWLEAFGLNADQPRPKTGNWTGAEIRACCRLAALLDVSLVEAAQNVVPVAATASESVEGLRKWARGRCLNADAPGIYGETLGMSRGSRRSVGPTPSAN